VVTGVVVVSALSLNATLDAQPASKPSDFPDELRVLIYALDTILLVITATTLVAVALLAVRERYREFGVLKAVGFTPGQIVSSIVGANAAVAVLASFVAIPIGIAVYFALVAIASGTTKEAVIAAWWSLALIPVGAFLLVVAATSVPAWLATRIHAADALRYE
jgi:putative ABC transport system permease protein